jgi:putative membrane protein
MKTVTILASLLLAVPAFAKAEAAKKPSDANIAAIAVTANAIDVDAGNAAIAKTTNPKVKEFAQLMVTDHSAVNKQAAELAGKLKLTPEEDDTARTLKKNAEDTAAKMKSLTGAEFDKAYVANEIAYHKAVLDALDKVLIPDAQNAELKALLKKVRPVVAEHMHHAEQLSKSL